MTDEPVTNTYHIHQSPWQPLLLGVIMTLLIVGMVCGTLLVRVNGLILAGVEARGACIVAVEER